MVEKQISCNQRRYTPSRQINILSEGLLQRFAGKVTSIRAFCGGGLEVEYGFTTPDWAAAPTDADTLRVVAGGMKVLHDPRDIIAKMQQGIESGEAWYCPPLLGKRPPDS